MNCERRRERRPCSPSLCKHGCGETPTPSECPGHWLMEGRPYSTVGSLMRGGICGAAARKRPFGVSCAAGGITARRHSLPATGHAGSGRGVSWRGTRVWTRLCLFLMRVRMRAPVCGDFFFWRACARAHACTCVGLDLNRNKILIRGSGKD